MKKIVLACGAGAASTLVAQKVAQLEGRNMPACQRLYEAQIVRHHQAKTLATRRRPADRHHHLPLRAHLPVCERRALHDRHEPRRCQRRPFLTSWLSRR